MRGQWQTISVRQLLRELKVIRERMEKLGMRHEVHYREFEDTATKEIVIRIIPHTGVTPHE